MNPIDLTAGAEILAHVATAAGLIVGGLWTYGAFQRRREQFPRAQIEHQISHRAVDAAHVLISIDTCVTNNGEVRILLDDGLVSVHQVLPPAAELARRLDAGDDLTGVEIIEWKLLGIRRERWEPGQVAIEPGETHQLHYDVVVAAGVETLAISVYFQNRAVRGRPLGWERTLLYDVAPLTPSLAARPGSRPAWRENSAEKNSIRQPPFARPSRRRA